LDDASLFRYTNFASLIDLLVKRKISLLDPGKWTDRNDSAFIKLYGSSLGFKSLYAICFTSSVETSHHWHAFAPGTDGVRIEFDKYGLIEDLSIPEHNHCLDKVVHRARVIDRDNDSYFEKITDYETGEIIHHCEELLSQHQNHGSAKKRSD